MRGFFTPNGPWFHRVLLIESGSRYLYENVMTGLYETHPENLRTDLVTCYPGVPKGLDMARGDVYRVAEYAGREGRKRLYSELRAKRYDVVVMICSGEPIMTKWKWALAANLPAKVLILNENGDHFWFDRAHWKTIRHFVLFRAGLAGADAVTTLSRLALFPFTFLYLLLYAAFVHLRRKLRA